MATMFEGRTDDQGRVCLTEPANIPGGAKVYVYVVEDEDEVGGIPDSMLLAQPALSEYWDRPEEDEAWKDFQDENQILFR